MSAYMRRWYVCGIETITGKYSCRKMFEESRHFRAHNLNVKEMRLLFSLRCPDPGLFVRGERRAGRYSFTGEIQLFSLGGGRASNFFQEGESKCVFL